MKVFTMLVLFLSIPFMLFSSIDTSLETLEESGISGIINDNPRYDQQRTGIRASVLLIPDSNADVVAMFNPQDGTYLGDFIIDDSTGVNYDLRTPINAIQGPLGFIFLSDQVSDAVYVFDSTGSFLYIAADTSDGLNNIRGIDFRNDTLFVTSGDDYIAMFNEPHSFAGYFIQDGSEPFDILFLSDERSLVCDIQGSADNIRLYNANGTLNQELFSINFPEQVQFDISLPGEFLNAAFSENQITEFEIDGTILNTFTFNSCRGIYRLGNGNLLVTDGNGVWELDSATGSTLHQEYAGSCRFIELCEVSLGVEETNTGIKNVEIFSLTPNPFSNELVINYSLTAPENINISVYSVIGTKVRTLVNANVQPGNNVITWNGKNDSGQLLTDGVYFVNIRTESEDIREKITFIK